MRRSSRTSGRTRARSGIWTRLLGAPPPLPRKGEGNRPSVWRHYTEHGALMPYLTNTTSRRIQWGECDPAGIVFYPRYFEMFDGATTAMFSAGTGLTKYQMFEAYKFAGYPMVDTRARFLIPCRFGDDVTIETTMTEG